MWRFTKWKIKYFLQIPGIENAKPGKEWIDFNFVNIYQNCIKTCVHLDVIYNFYVIIPLPNSRWSGKMNPQSCGVRALLNKVFLHFEKKWEQNKTKL